MKSILFSTVEVTRQVFYKTSLSYAVVNLKPIVPGREPFDTERVVTRLRDLEGNELADLMLSVQRVGNVIERVYGADALTIACQDGKAAGQTMPHVHFHLLPRKQRGDRFEENKDQVYPELERTTKSLPEEFEAAISSPPTPGGRPDQGVEPLKVDADEDRKPRTMEEMAEEAEWLKGFFRDVPGQELD
ncbi:hypothetical protein NM688_g861 [Phlebia brevispora]|uniref:Uncharacterized protein n=1 Tax=Phlebia brevispora TaxID=194682 RepID=A0ACC1TCX3_9APHY|nr:hypothetical protein NM688_g861 [Phlebia brevispora]